MTPAKAYLLFRNKWKKEWTLLLCSVFLFGFAAHLYKLVNILPNWDSLNNVYSSQNTIHLGRCFLTLACGISSYYDLPWLNGALSLLYLGVTAILVSEIFRLKKKPVLILAGGLLVSFPAVTSTFAYMYTADGYFLGMLCMTLAIYLTLRFKKGWIGGLFLICFGYGCYQAYITWAILLVLFWSMEQLLFTDRPVRSLLLKWGHFLLCGMLGTILYYICNNLLLSIQGISLASYQGIRDAGLASFHPLTAIRQCIIEFAYFFIGSIRHMNLYSCLNILMLVCMIVFTALHIIRHQLYRRPLRFILLLCIAAAVPFAAFAIYFISPGTGYHMLMMMGLYLVYLYFILFYEKAKTAGGSAVRQWLILLLSGFILYNFILTANICYQAMQTSYDKSLAMINRIAGRIEQTPGALSCKKMTVIGRLPDSEDLSLNLPPDMTGITSGYLMSSPLHYRNMLSHYCAMDYELADEEEAALLEAGSADHMAAWPEEGCIAIINDTLVIRMGSE